MSATFTESVVEEAALEWSASLGYAVVSGPTSAADEAGAERAIYNQVVLEGRLRDALSRGVFEPRRLLCQRRNRTSLSRALFSFGAVQKPAGNENIGISGASYLRVRHGNRRGASRRGQQIATGTQP